LFISTFTFWCFLLYNFIADSLRYPRGRPCAFAGSAYSYYSSKTSCVLYLSKFLFLEPWSIRLFSSSVIQRSQRPGIFPGLLLPSEASDSSTPPSRRLILRPSPPISPSPPLLLTLLFYAPPRSYPSFPSKAFCFFDHSPSTFPGNPGFLIADASMPFFSSLFLFFPLSLCRHTGALPSS